MKVYDVTFLFLLFLSHATFAQRSSVKIPSDLTLKAWMQENKVFALAIGVIENNKVSYTRVLGELKKGVPAPANAIFQVASLTKPVAEITALQLVSQGLWDLDEPLYHYWTDPDVKDDPQHKQLTTRHVISHQTGFLNWRWLHKTGKLTFDFPPGTKTQYSGEGLEYLKHALVNRFNMPFEAIVDKYLFKPYGMSDTRFYWDKNMDETRYAVAHNKEGEPYPIRKNTEPSAADLMMTTIIDYTHFGEQVLHKKGLSRSVYKDMLTFQGPDKKYGLGWALYKHLQNDELVLMHGGSDPGVRTMMILLPKSKRGLIIFTNSDNGNILVKNIISQSLDIGDELIERSTK